MSTSQPRLSILVPVYNELPTVGRLLDRVRQTDLGAPFEIVVVDDGSRDGTREVLAALPPGEQVLVVLHEVNRGKGAAVRTALGHARGHFVVIQDADLELDPSEIRGLLARAEAGAPVVYGSRFAGDNRAFLRMPTYWANRFLTLLSNLLNGQHLTDMNTCYKLMPTTLARELDLKSPGFAMEPEITTKLARRGVAIVEVPIRYLPRDSASGKKIRASDLFRYLKAMVRFRFESRSS